MNRGEALKEIELSIKENRGAILIGAELNDTHLSSANLSGADLRDADLSGADLRDADLSGADLRDAYMIGADLTGADPTGADLRGADLRGAETNYGTIKAFKYLGETYKYKSSVYITEDGLEVIRMGCLEKTLEEWLKIGIGNSNLDEFPDDGSEKSELRKQAFSQAVNEVRKLKETK